MGLAGLYCVLAPNYPISQSNLPSTYCPGIGMPLVMTNEQDKLNNNILLKELFHKLNGQNLTMKCMIFSVKILSDRTNQQKAIMSRDAAAVVAVPQIFI